MSPSLTPALEGLSSFGPAFISTVCPSRRTHRLFHLRRCSDLFNIHRPARRGPFTVVALAAATTTAEEEEVNNEVTNDDERSPPYVFPSVTGLPVASLMPGDRGGGYDGVRGGASSGRGAQSAMAAASAICKCAYSRERAGRRATKCLSQEAKIKSTKVLNNSSVSLGEKPKLRKTTFGRTPLCDSQK